MRTVQRVAVLGAGTMGSRIAAHFANAGIRVLLLDIVLPNEPDRNAAAKRGLETAAKSKPAAFFTDAAMSLVRTGNFEDDLEHIGGCDWIIEAVTENLEIKRNLFARVEQLRREGSIVSSNTSGIPLGEIARDFSDELRRNFLGTHFFNPPRYLHLVEVIPWPATREEITEFVTEFCERRLGKGVVPCKDTPNFIANRIGTFFGSTVYKLTTEGGYTIEEVDALTGPAIGLPKSASYRLLDIVGLDVWAFVSNNLYQAATEDPWRERFLTPDFMRQMLERKWLGDKTGQGFYKRVGKEREIHAIDWKTLEYHPAQKVSFPSLEAVRSIEDIGERVRALLAAKDRAGDFLWKLLSDLWLYSASMIPEIADRVVEIDRAMRWGYANKMGPFELWDAVGFRDVVDRMVKEGRELPSNVANMRQSEAKGFYQVSDYYGEPRMQYFDLYRQYYQEVEARPGVMVLGDIKRAKGAVKSNAGASLIDIGDGVLCVEFHSKMNALGEDNVGMIYAGLEELAHNFDAMVIANQADNFSVGANLMMVLLAAQEEEWDELNAAIHRFQQANMAIKYAPKPVVVAPFNQTLGGGCEIALHGTRAQASAELYMGLVEVGVGLIPGAGGCKELLVRLKDPRKVFELIGMAKVSTSAEEARNLGLLHRLDRITMNPERLVADAKALALELARDYTPGQPRTDIKVGGEAVFSMLKIGAWTMRQSGYISDHDLAIGEKLANVLAGGRVSGEQTVSEQYLLDLEREAFLSLCGTAKTQERMQFMLKTGKPLRN